MAGDRRQERLGRIVAVEDQQVRAVPIEEIGHLLAHRCGARFSVAAPGLLSTEILEETLASAMVGKAGRRRQENRLYLLREPLCHRSRRTNMADPTPL